MKVWMCDGEWCKCFGGGPDIENECQCVDDDDDGVCDMCGAYVEAITEESAGA